MKLNLIINCAFCIVNCTLLISCASNRPVVTAHVKRIEERVMPVAVGADTIEITEYRLQSANFPPSPAVLPLKQVENMRANQFSANAQKYDSPILSPYLRGTSNAEGGKIKSTRAVNIQQTKTDTTRTLRITLRPDTVFIPYTTHIRSDTIVIPDRICKTKLQKTQTASVMLILILIAIIIIFIKRKHF